MQMLRSCVEANQPFVDSVVQAITGESVDELDGKQSQLSLEQLHSDFPDHIQGQRELMNNEIQCSEGLEYEVKHLQALKHGLQQEAEPDAGIQTPTLLLQGPTSLVDKPVTGLQKCRRKPGIEGPKNDDHITLGPIHSEVHWKTTIRESIHNRDVATGLAPIAASPRRNTFARAGRSASCVISALHDRVRYAKLPVATRNLKFQWNRKLVMTQGSNGGAAPPGALV